MKELKGAQRKYLRGLAHNLNPSAYVGQKGLTPTLIEEIDLALNATELIKLKFVEFKLKAQKNEILDQVLAQTGAQLAGMIGHVAILYRRHTEKEKRSITLP